MTVRVTVVEDGTDIGPGDPHGPSITSSGRPALQGLPLETEDLRMF